MGIHTSKKAGGFERRGYLIGVGAQVKVAGRALPLRLLWGPNIGNPTPAETDMRGYQAPEGVALHMSGAPPQRLPGAKLNVPHPVADARWAGVDSQYFAALLI